MSRREAESEDDEAVGVGQQEDIGDALSMRHRAQSLIISPHGFDLRERVTMRFRALPELRDALADVVIGRVRLPL